MNDPDQPQPLPYPISAQPEATSFAHSGARQVGVPLALPQPCLGMLVSHTVLSHMVPDNPGLGLLPAHLPCCGQWDEKPSSAVLFGTPCSPCPRNAAGLLLLTELVALFTGHHECWLASQCQWVSTALHKPLAEPSVKHQPCYAAFAYGEMLC